MKGSIRHIIAIILTIVCVFEVSAQSNLRSLLPTQQKGSSNSISRDIPANKTDKPAGRGSSTRQQHAYPRSLIEPVADDTVYCHSTAKQRGWFKPLGILTKEQARHRNQSLMFTGRNSKGHWTKMESVDALGRHVPGGNRPYIAKNGAENDSLFNKEWAARLEKSCIFEFVPDPSGDNIIQERVYDKDHNLIFAYSRTPVGNNQFIGSYKDYYGLPAEMRADMGYSYGTLVRISEDKWGNAVRIEYLDSKGGNKLNADSAFAEVFEYDEQGRPLLQYSVDSFDNKILDNWGNCGIVYTYDDNHLILSAMYTDEQMNPMKMLSNKAGSKIGTIKHKYVYDQYGRMSDEVFVTDTDAPDTNIYGCHRITYEYDSLGKLIRQTGYGIDGSIIAQDNSGTAIYSIEYDDSGNQKKIEFLDKDGLPVSTPGYLSRIEYNYDKSGNQVGQTQWITEDGNLKLSYSEQTDTVNGCRRYREQWEDGSCRINRYDEKDREIFFGDFDIDGKPIVKGDDWAYKTTDYIEIAPGKTKYIVSYYDETGNPASAREYNREFIVCDSLTRIEYLKQYKDDDLVNTFSKRYDKDFIHILEEADNNAFGVITRAGGVSGARHYNAKVRWTPFSAVSYIVGVDEFDEPDYIVTENGSVYYYSRFTAGGRRDMSIDNEIIDDDYNENLRNSLPKVMSIEVVDSCAYNLGIRDNDVILSYGDYYVDLAEPLNERDFKVDWTVRNVVDAGVSRDMVVFRVEDGPAGIFGIDTIHGLIGSPSDLGFITHIRYLTKKQADRISGCRNGSFVTTPRKENSKYVIIAYPEMFRSDRKKKYSSEITDPAVLTGACNVKHGLKWDYRDETDIDGIEKILKLINNTDDRLYPESILFFTKDGRSVIDMKSADGQSSGIKLLDGFIEESLYEKLMTQYSATAARIDNIYAKASRIDPKLMCGYWVTDSQDSTKNNVTGYLYLDKDGTCRGRINGFVYVPDSLIYEDYGSPVFSTKRSLDGRWSNADNFLCFRPDNPDNSVIGRCVDIIDPTGDVGMAVDYFDEDYPKYPNYYEYRMTSLRDINNEAIVKHVDKRRLILVDVRGNEIVFCRQKGRPTLNDDMPAVYPTDSITGCWVGSESDSEKTISMLLSFAEGGYVDLNMSLIGGPGEFDENAVVNISINADGRWKAEANQLTLDIDTTNISCDFNFINLGHEENYEKLMMIGEEACNKMRGNMAGIFGEPIPVTVKENGKMILDGAKLQKVTERKTIICGSIEGDDGYLAKAGLSGNFVILRWCDWICDMDLEDFKSEFEKCRDGKKTIVLLPFSTAEDDVTFGQPLLMDCPEGILGIRIGDLEVPYPYFFKEMLSRYLMVK